jgi:2-isopropylmalate synthase
VFLDVFELQASAIARFDRASLGNRSEKMSEKVTVFDTTLRDGEQAAGVCFSARDKLEIARQLAAMHVDVIEAGFPAASGAEADAVAAVAKGVPGATICALARAVPFDIDAAADAIRGAARGRIHVFINSSDVHLARQLKKDRQDVLAMTRESVARARNATGDVEFSPMDATRADPEFVAEVVRVALAAGATTINIPDTVGCALPHQVERLIRELFERVPEIAEAVVSFHGQDDLGFATANTIAAVRGGARQVELAVNGIGERAGNTAFEEVVMALRVHSDDLGVYTGVEPNGICAISRLVEERSGISVPLNKAVVGGNAFRHASGIHQDGVIKWRENYEVLDPEVIGHATGTEIVLGKLSGRSGFAERVRALGIEMPGDSFGGAFDDFQQVANRQGEVHDAQLQRICEAAVAREPVLLRRAGRARNAV